MCRDDRINEMSDAVELASGCVVVLVVVCAASFGLWMVW